MANLTDSNGVSGVDGGSPSVIPNAVTGAYGTAWSDNGNLAVADNCAVRRSVSITGGGTYAANASKVFSETQGLRFAYASVESDAPALDASRS